MPKPGWLRYRNSRDVLGQAKNITINQTSGKWYASLQTEREVPQPLPTATTAIGIDMGIARFATLSDGSCAQAVAEGQGGGGCQGFGALLKLTSSLLCELIHGT